MAEMLLEDTLKELRALIDQQHLLYLECDENPQKINQRGKLEGYIKDYLYLAPHDTKFTLQQTANVLHQSARNNVDFSAYKAAVAWKAIGKYADNLISHPWRKEYRNIKLYCGFYKHEIEENLVGAELMFEAMGYRPSGPSSLSLLGILDPDRITSVSKDAVLAYVECQILKQIWEALSAQYNVTWLEILEFRESHIGTPDQVIRALTYKLCQRHYQSQIYPRHIDSVNNHLPQPECLYRQYPLGFYNENQFPLHTYSLPLHTGYGTMINPHQQVISSPPVYTPSHLYASSRHLLRLQDFNHPINGHHRHTHYPSEMEMNNYIQNGYPIEAMIHNASSIVPTGRLIEVDSSPNHNGNELHSQRPSTFKPNYSEDEMLHQLNLMKNEGLALTLSGKAKNDGAGSWENWDYVYRNLECNSYKKNLEPTTKIVKENQQSSLQTNSSDVDTASLVQSGVSDKFRKISLDESNDIGNNSSRVFLDDEFKSKVIKEKNRGDIEKFKEANKIKISKLTKTSPEKVYKDNSSSSDVVSNLGYAKGNINQKKENSTQLQSKGITKAKKQRDEIRPLVVNLSDDDKDKWQCITCTYLNSVSNNVCEMCSKSKERGSELNPQPTGGQECPKCTLVNIPGLSNCGACNASLKNSPTYI